MTLKQQLQAAFNISPPIDYELLTKAMFAAARKGSTQLHIWRDHNRNKIIDFDIIYNDSQYKEFTTWCQKQGLELVFTEDYFEIFWGEPNE